MSAHMGQLFELGLRLIPAIVKAGFAIYGIGGQAGPSAPVALNVWPSLMAICPATQALNGMLGLMCSAMQTAVQYADTSALIGWPVRVVVFVVSSLADYSINPVGGCVEDCLVSCLHSMVLQQVLGFFLHG
jgi:hypothetical protein